MEQAQRNGGRQSRPLADRFWDFVDKHGPVPQHQKKLGKCWVWTGGRTGTGRHRYGVINIGGQRRSGLIRAHRASWELHRGPIPDGLCVLHRCDHPLCVRPSHLFLGSHADNTADMVRKRRESWGRAPNPRATLPAYPERFVRPRLRPEDVVELREWLAFGMTTADLSFVFGVSDTMIYHVRSGRRWGSVQSGLSDRPIGEISPC